MAEDRKIKPLEGMPPYDEDAEIAAWKKHRERQRGQSPPASRGTLLVDDTVDSLFEPTLLTTVTTSSGSCTAETRTMRWQMVDSIF